MAMYQIVQPYFFIAKRGFSTAAFVNVNFFQNVCNSLLDENIY